MSLKNHETPTNAKRGHNHVYTIQDPQPGLLLVNRVRPREICSNAHGYYKFPLIPDLSCIMFVNFQMAFSCSILCVCHYSVYCRY